MTFLDVKASNRRFISYQLHGTWNEQAMAGIAHCIIHHHTTQVTTVAQICQFPWLGDSGQLRKFNQSNGLNLIARAHQLVMEGFNWAHEQLLRSISLVAYIFSTAETQRTADHSRTFRIQEHDANCIWHLVSFVVNAPFQVLHEFIPTWIQCSTCMHVPWCAQLKDPFVLYALLSMVVHPEQHDRTQLGPQASRDHFLCAELLLQIWESGSDHGRWNATSVGGRWWEYVHLDQPFVGFINSCKIYFANQRALDIIDIFNKGSQTI